MRNMNKLRGELDDTHGADLERNRTLNDMHESTRKELADLLRVETGDTAKIEQGTYARGGRDSKEQPHRW